MNENIKQLQLGLTKEIILQTLGEPKKTYIRDEYEILQYNSIAPSLADLLYFENGVLVLKEMSVKKDGVILNQLIAQYGSPTSTYALFPEENSSSFDTLVYAWYGQGIDAVVYGELGNAQVGLVRFFEPTDEVYYERTFGRNWADGQINLIAESPTIISSEQLQLSQEETQAIEKLETKVEQTKMMTIFGGIIFLIIIIIVVALFLRKWLKQRRLVSSTPSLPDSSPQNLPPQVGQ